jgi:hypothetical protein
MPDTHNPIGDDCKRRQITIDDEHFYLIIGRDFVHATVPHENRLENQKLRQLVDTICATITAVQGGQP